MNIPDANAFYHFVKANNLVGLSPEIGGMVRCIDELARMCGNCDGQNNVNAKRGMCTNLYIQFVSRAGNFKNQLFGATGGTIITFYDGQRYLGNITR